MPISCCSRCLHLKRSQLLFELAHPLPIRDISLSLLLQIFPSSFSYWDILFPSLGWVMSGNASKFVFKWPMVLPLPLVCQWSNYSLFHVIRRWNQSPFLYFQLKLLDETLCYLRSPLLLLWLQKEKSKLSFNIFSWHFWAIFNTFSCRFWAIFWSNLGLISCPRAVAARSSRHNFPSRGE